jgi:8-oxo-dGTP pyrophosphatase MutT (NUDIX family)
MPYRASKDHVDYECNHFEVIKTKKGDHHYYFVRAPDGVAMLPYVRDPDGTVSFFIREERIPAWGDGHYTTCVLGTVDKEDPSPFDTLLRELREETGFDLEEFGRQDAERRTTSLGSFRESKRTTRTVHYYLLDVSGIPQREATGDGTALEDQSRTIEIAPSDVMAQDVPLRFLMLAYREVFGIPKHLSFQALPPKRPSRKGIGPLRILSRVAKHIAQRVYTRPAYPIRPTTATKKAFLVDTLKKPPSLWVENSDGSVALTQHEILDGPSLKKYTDLEDGQVRVFKDLTVLTVLETDNEGDIFEGHTSIDSDWPTIRYLVEERGWSPTEAAILVSDLCSDCANTIRAELEGETYNETPRTFCHYCKYIRPEWYKLKIEEEPELERAQEQAEHRMGGSLRNLLFSVRAYIRELPSGKYRVYSESGKNLGTENTREEAENRLKQVEYFKHKRKKDMKANRFGFPPEESTSPPDPGPEKTEEEEMEDWIQTITPGASPEVSEAAYHLVLGFPELSVEYSDPSGVILYIPPEDPSLPEDISHFIQTKNGFPPVTYRFEPNDADEGTILMLSPKKPPKMARGRVLTQRDQIHLADRSIPAWTKGITIARARLLCPEHQEVLSRTGKEVPGVLLGTCWSCLPQRVKKSINAAYRKALEEPDEAEGYTGTIEDIVGGGSVFLFLIRDDAGHLHQLSVGHRQFQDILESEGGLTGRLVEVSGPQWQESVQFL